MNPLIKYEQRIGLSAKIIYTTVRSVQTTMYIFETNSNCHCFFFFYFTEFLKLLNQILISNTRQRLLRFRLKIRSANSFINIDCFISDITGKKKKKQFVISKRKKWNKNGTLKKVAHV